MNIKAKLIEQLEVLEGIQSTAFRNEQLELAHEISKTILECIGGIKYESNDDYICPECEESQLKEILHQDIANACDLPIELVNRVLAGQNAVLDT